MSTSKSIALIIGSTRKPRVGDKVAAYVKSVIDGANRSGDNGAEGSTRMTVTVVDLDDFSLPIFDEPMLPAAVPVIDGYAHAHTRKWAAEIAKHDGYILVSPEYNYGVPGGVKNAIDFLYNEWKGKPVMIVTYGIHGGRDASNALQITFSKTELRVVTTRPMLYFPGGQMGPGTLEAVFKGVLAEETAAAWAQSNGGEITKAFQELKELVSTPAPSA
jgi:NAD(P)H-dependent FMN reductase